MSAGEFCNREVVIVERNCSVQEAINLMRAAHVGNVVVVDEEKGVRKPVGILTDRDIVVEILAEDVELDVINVGDVMSFKLLTVQEDTPIWETARLMRDRGVRRVPVVNEQGGLEGIISVDDIIDLLAELLSDLAGLITREQKRESKTRI